MKHRALTLWIVTAATLWAAVMRFVRIDTLAPAAWFDEVWFALRARELLQTGQFHAFYPTYFGGANAGLVYLTAIVQVLGIDTITSARWVLAAFGVLAVPLAYQCFRHLIPQRGNRVGMLAAIFLAYTMFDVIITRVGMESGIAPAVAMFVVWQMIVAARTAGDSSPRLRAASQPQSPINGTGSSAHTEVAVPFRGLRASKASSSRGFQSSAHWALAGLVLGLSQYNGLHARFILPVAAYVALDMLISGRGHRREVLRGLVIMAAAGIVVMLPLIAYFAQNPEWLTARAGVVAQSGLDRYVDNFMQIVRVISIEGSYDPKTTVPGVPLLDLVQTIGFIAGIGWAALNLHRSRGARVLLVWLIVAMLPGILTDGPNLQRMINIAAPLAGITAVGWELIWQRIQKAIQPRRDGEHREKARKLLRLSAAMCIYLILASLMWHAHLVMVRWPQEPKLSAQFTAPPVTLAREAVEASSEQVIFAERAPEAEDIIGWEFLFPGTGVMRLDLRQCLPMPHQRDVPTGYLILEERDNITLDKLRALYPQSYFRARGVDLWQDTASWLEVPAGAEAPAPEHAVHARFEAGIALIGYEWSADEVHPGESVSFKLYWHADSWIDVDYTAFAHIGTGLDGSQIVAQRDGSPCLGLYPTSQWHAGEIIPDPFTIIIPADAPPGDYPVAVGWYHYPSPDRLPLIEADMPLPDNRAVIGTLHVAAP